MGYRCANSLAFGGDERDGRAPFREWARQNPTEAVIHEWELQEAKNNLSQLIKKAVGGEPQAVTVHGEPAVVVVSAEEYARLTRPRRGKLSAALLQPGLAGEELDISRSRDTGREVEL